MGINLEVKKPRLGSVDLVHVSVLNNFIDSPQDAEIRKTAKTMKMVKMRLRRRKNKRTGTWRRRRVVRRRIG